MKFIQGWSLNPDLRLIRNEEGKQTLGELLIEKANSGVIVNLLLWKETGSKVQSNLDTGDNYAKKYFKDSKVNVNLNRRSGYSGLLFSHHQKSVILDTKYGNQTSVMSYIGGIDLTGGRYDTNDHPLFSTLMSEHKDDIFQTVTLENPKLGPRLPWHDIHVKFFKFFSFPV
jgi:phospholipase D1/2